MDEHSANPHYHNCMFHPHCMFLPHVPQHISLICIIIQRDACATGTHISCTKHGPQHSHANLLVPLRQRMRSRKGGIQSFEARLQTFLLFGAFRLLVSLSSAASLVFRSSSLDSDVLFLLLVLLFTSSGLPRGAASSRPKGDSICACAEFGIKPVEGEHSGIQLRNVTNDHQLHRR